MRSQADPSRTICAPLVAILACLGAVWGPRSAAPQADRPIAVRVMIGVDYSPFRDGQNPNAGSFPTAGQMQADMPVLRQMANVVRTYSSTNGLDQIVGAARSQGLSAAPGAWLSDNASSNRDETDKLIAVAAQNTNVVFVVVGNEAILRFENGGGQGLPASSVIAQINRVRPAVGVAVTTSEPWHIWRDHPELVAAVDLIFLSVHPYWEGQHIDDAAGFVVQRYTEIKNKYPGKRIVISETGWPSAGNPFGRAQPSLANQAKFIAEFVSRAHAAKIEFFFFEAFDENWKLGEPNGVGPHWGFYSAQRNPKHGPIGLRLPAAVGVSRHSAWFLDANGNDRWDGCAMDACPVFGLATDLPVVGDWAGTGQDTLGVFRNGFWSLDLNGNGQWDGCTMDACQTFGLATDLPVVGDWTGDGRAKLGVFRNGSWFLDLNGNGQWDGCLIDACRTFGFGGDIPVVGDWTGDGRAKLGVFRNGFWSLDFNGNGLWDGCAVDACVGFGLAGDTPVVGRW